MGSWALSYYVNYKNTGFKCFIEGKSPGMAPTYPGSPHLTKPCLS